MPTIRRAFPEDHPAYSRLFAELEIPDPVPPLDLWWERQGPSTLIAEQAGEVRGYLWFERLGPTLYIRNVVSDPRARRSGIGKRLLREALRLGAASGARDWCLNVKDDNVAAITLYESFGLRTAYVSRVVRVAWDALTSRVRSPGTMILREPAPEEDAHVERVLQLLGGQLQRLRAQQRVLMAAFDASDATPMGLAAFDPAFPGAYPFRARDLDVCAALLDALAPHRVQFPPGSGWRTDSLQLVVEREDALAESLQASGATPVFRILHMRAPLDPAGDGRAQTAGPNGPP